jgi:2-hydroxy-6-oxonona-2,4-dienedioate hydrolase
MTMIERTVPWARPSSRAPRAPSSPRLVSRYIDVDGITMHTKVSAGPIPVGRPPVVLVHGLVVSGRYMEPLAECLATDTRVFAPDLPGYGRSDKPRGTTDVASLALSLDRWMEAVDLEQAIIVANSFGCQIAARLAATYPARVSELVLLGPMVEPSARNALVLAARGLANVRFEPASLGWIIAQDLWAMGVPRALSLIYTMLTDHIEVTLPHVRARTHIVRGERDTLASRSWIRTLIDVTPIGESAEITGAGHALNYNAPGRVATLVRSLIH